jgi:hypothetical protein
MATWLLICVGLTVILLGFFVLLALLDPDAIPAPFPRLRRRSHHGTTAHSTRRHPKV